MRKYVILDERGTVIIKTNHTGEVENCLLGLNGNGEPTLLIRQPKARAEIPFKGSSRDLLETFQAALKMNSGTRPSVALVRMRHAIASE